jgi:hypothetical protein
LLEFQSQPDPFVALRMLVYVGLLYQELVKPKQPTRGGRLPPVLPLVLYTRNTHIFGRIARPAHPWLRYAKWLRNPAPSFGPGRNYLTRQGVRI